MASKTNNDNEPLWLGDQLPTMYDVATTVFFLAPSLQSNKSKFAYPPPFPFGAFHKGLISVCVCVCGGGIFGMTKVCFI